MSISETSGNEETTHSNKEQLLTVVRLLRAFKRPYKYAHIDVHVVEDLKDTETYRLSKNKNRWKIVIRKPMGAIQRVYPDLSFAWASLLNWNKLPNSPTKYPVGWGESVAECWRIITGETTNAIRSKLK